MVMKEEVLLLICTDEEVEEPITWGWNMTQFSESNDRFEGGNTIEHHAVCDEQQSN